MTYLSIEELQPFRPASTYHHGLDVLTYQVLEGTPVAEPVDSFLTILWNAEQTDLIGIKCKGFRYYFNQVRGQAGLEAHDFLPLVELLEAVFTLGVGDHLLDSQREKYDLAKECVRSHHLTKDELKEYAA